MGLNVSATARVIYQGGGDDDADSDDEMSVSLVEETGVTACMVETKLDFRGTYGLRYIARQPHRYHIEST